jgi:hypothetical protein
MSPSPMTEVDAEAARRIRWIGAGLLSWLSQCLPSPAEVSDEIRALARRHPGRATRGAQQELSQSRHNTDRARLLRACIYRLES